MNRHARNIFYEKESFSKKNILTKKYLPDFKKKKSLYNNSTNDKLYFAILNLKFHHASKKLRQKMCF